MVLFPNCKINIGLNVTDKRPDGYHNIETIFYPIQWCDAIEVIQSPSLLDAGYFTATGLPVPGKQEDNICVKAYQLLKKDFPQLPSIKMHLHKVIPMGAGLGGGSADGAFALLLINKKFNLALSSQQLIGYASRLGSDCPFFIVNQPCFATGRGEKMVAVSLDLSGYSFLVVHPGIHIDTALAFSKLTPRKPEKSIRTIIQQPIETWKQELINDFEYPIFKEFPKIRNMKQLLYDTGALFASLSGSGSSVYGIFAKNQLPQLNLASHYRQKKIF